MRLKINNVSGIPDYEVLPIVRYAASFFGFSGDVECAVKRTSRHHYYGTAWWSRRYCVLHIQKMEYKEPIKVDHLVYFRSHQIEIKPFELRDWKESLVHLAAHEFAHLTKPGHNWRKSRREVYCENRATEVLEAYRTPEGQEKVGSDSRVIQTHVAAKECIETAKKIIASSPERKLDRLKELQSTWERKSKLATTKLKKIRKRIKYYEKKTQLDLQPA